MDNKQWWWWLGSALMVYLLGVNVNVMDVDAAQYAAMSREMMQSGSYLQVFEQGEDYLDKPPMVFWLCSASMKIFGVNNFAYKLPSILFALLAIFSTYRFAHLYYNRTIAQLSALVLATTQSLFLITNDCRTDTILMGCVAFTFWHLAAAFLKNDWRHFLLGFVGIGLGMLTKGPIAFLLPAMAFSVHFIFKKEYKNFLRLEYLWGLVVIGILLFPMCYGLYTQFDLHPEKIIDGKTSTSGLRFYFWIQSFGRITGENDWRNDVYFTYLMLTMAWSLLPWTVLFVAGYFGSIFDLFKEKTKLYSIDNQEFITLGGCTLGYISLATSKYQLPHYVFVIYPLAAVITARFMYDLFYENKFGLGGKILRGAHWFLITALWAIPYLVVHFVFPFFLTIKTFGAIFIGVAALIYVIGAFQRKNIIKSSIYTALIINVFACTFFYPQLLTFEEGCDVGKKMYQEKVPENQFFTFQYNTSSALHFYAQRIVKRKDKIEEVNFGDIFLTGEQGMQALQDFGYDLDYLESGNTFSVTNLTLSFLDDRTRQNVVGQYYLVRIKGLLKKEVEEEIDIEKTE
jgi:4-amino-4-deoxy-L-arabinose transferase-like glycosyltransferase